MSVIDNYLPPTLYVLKKRNGSGLDCKQIEDGIYAVRAFTFKDDATPYMDKEVKIEELSIASIVEAVYKGQQKGLAVVGFVLDNAGLHRVS